VLSCRASLPLSRQTLNLAAGFRVGTATAWRYVEETVALLALVRRMRNGLIAGGWG